MKFRKWIIFFAWYQAVFLLRARGGIERFPFAPEIALGLLQKCQLGSVVCSTCVLDTDWLRSLFSLLAFLEDFSILYFLCSSYFLQAVMIERKLTCLTAVVLWSTPDFWVHPTYSPRRAWASLHWQRFFTRTAVRISVAPSLMSPRCRANLVESRQAMPSYPLTSGAELGTSRSECRKTQQCVLYLK